MDTSLTQSTAEIMESEDDNFESVCSEIFTELVETWLEKNAMRLFGETQNRLLTNTKKRKT